MKRKLFLLLGILATLTISSFAQNTNTQSATALKLREADDIEELFRPRRAEDRRTGVGAAVVINTAEVGRSAFELINKKRAQSGLRPLIWSDELAEVARVHSSNMAEFNFFSHRGLDNKMVSDRADALRVGRWRAIGENIAFNRGFQDPVAKAVELWLDSTTHRKNLLDQSWQESGIGVAVAEDGSFYFTQVFLARR